LASGEVPYFHSSVVRAGTELQVCPTKTVPRIHLSHKKYELGLAN
jgi:hypothetical protein